MAEGKELKSFLFHSLYYHLFIFFVGLFFRSFYFFLFIFSLLPFFWSVKVSPHSTSTYPTKQSIIPKSQAVDPELEVVRVVIWAWQLGQTIPCGVGPTRIPVRRTGAAMGATKIRRNIRGLGHCILSSACGGNADKTSKKELFVLCESKKMSHFSKEHDTARHD